ncbi:dimethylaniline monooxygenase [Diaporthe amygdali]|uniref:dimethylaniline monooxygenase n=1 Tax=Phomopsis amygdali TaxID=1214568 RepID=UPI0022FF150C|nr:dimethylaniline monooxygenase [Diaporthe amygdali]KAJ0109976.1 dimethylaniline monooxygenase [Diaporthe amygdali]
MAQVSSMPVRNGCSEANRYEEHRTEALNSCARGQADMVSLAGLPRKKPPGWNSTMRGSGLEPGAVRVNTAVELGERDIAHMIAWNKGRYLSNGELGHLATFDSVLYVDKLLDEIGLTEHRKKGWLGNMFSPIMPADLGRVWQEYLAMRTKQ